ncbi:MAG: hypothetical protein VX193_01350, partial [Candidatus Thermoplasmatota archaeon]|nr:hypothetical protein [Candidatus Thermoplasmatota archaeon]
MPPVGTLWSSGKRGTDEEADDNAEATATEDEGSDDAAIGAAPDEEMEEPPEAELLESEADALDLGATIGEGAPLGEGLDLASPLPDEERAELPPLLARAENMNMR